MKQTGYPFQYVGSNTIGADKYLQETHIYAFQSDKSGHRYQVHMEQYVNHLYCIKFFDVTVDIRTGKFSHLFEAHLVDAYSMCVLLNRRAVPDMDAYMQQILDFIAE